MSGIFLRWGIPALVTVVGGTSLAISATDATVTRDLTARTATVLTAEQRNWAAVRFDARDAVITGTATDQQMIDNAVRRVAAVHGVRSVTSGVVLAEFVSPFPFRATQEGGRVVLSGGVPDETVHREIVAKVPDATDSLRLMSGAPPVEAWRTAVVFGLDHLSELDEGTFTLDDLDMSVTGRARTPAAYDALALLANQVPVGTRLVTREIAPALADPFTFEASFNGSRVSVSGFAPTEAFSEALRTDGVGGWPVSTSLVLASGAPAAFEDEARSLLENLVKLESGSASISGDALALDGLPADSATADAVQLAMTSMGAIVTLAPPRVEGYEFIATREGSNIVLTGHVPDAATRDRLEELAGVDASGLELARGQPERFESAVEFGLDLLGRLSEGRFVISNTMLSISGRAATVADFTTVETTLAAGAPQGLVLAGAQIRPPMATPFLWSARKDADGGVRLAGFVPSGDARSALQALVPTLKDDTTTIADGNPENFATEASSALGLLPKFGTALIDYDGTRWTLSGVVTSAQDAFEIDQAFGAAGLRQAGWTLSLDLPRPAPVAALPIIDPYVWRAQKAADGRVTLGGFVPTEGLKKILFMRAGAGAIDTTNLGAGVPDGFILGTLAGIDALQMLKEGSLGFDGRSWTLTGQVASTADRLAAETSLRKAVDATDWQVAIQAQDAPRVVTPYRWMATKDAAGQDATDTTEVASGEPAGFTADVLAALEALGHLVSGTARYERGVWTLEGTPATAMAGTLAVAALEAAASGGPGWQYRLDDPLEPAPAAPELAIASVEPEALVEPAPEAMAPDVPAEAAAPEAPAEVPAEALPEAPPITEPVVEPAVPAETDVAVVPAPDAPVDASPEVAAPSVARNFVFSATKPLGQPIELRGLVPADATRRFFAVIAGDVPVDNVEVGDTLPGNFIPNADAGIRLLAALESGEFGLDGDTWVLSGKVGSEAARSAALASIAAVPAAAGWQTDVSLLPAIDICRERVGSFASRNAILFESGSARLAEESMAAIDELAGYLNSCPEVTVHVEGHTDADGDDALNLAISVSRAEAVVEALIDRGVGYQRLYAVGYGESLPIADNATAAGKRANRRIAFTILAETE